MSWTSSLACLYSLFLRLEMRFKNVCIYILFLCSRLPLFSWNKYILFPYRKKYQSSFVLYSAVGISTDIIYFMVIIALFDEFPCNNWFLINFSGLYFPFAFEKMRVLMKFIFTFQQISQNCPKDFLESEQFAYSTIELCLGYLFKLLRRCALYQEILEAVFVLFILNLRNHVERSIYWITSANNCNKDSFFFLFQA